MKLKYIIRFQIDAYDTNKGETLEEFHKRMNRISKRLIGSLRDVSFCDKCKQKSPFKYMEKGLCPPCQDKVRRETQK